MSFYSQIAFAGNLYRAWQRVECNDGAPGVDGVSINKFDVNLEANLSKLEKELISFAYKPLPLRRYEIPKANGKLRLLAVPAVRDRVAQTSACIVLQPVIERELEHCSFAYRRGLSRLTAIEHIRQLRNDGYRWILDADIESFFDNVDLTLLMERVLELVPEKETSALIEQWLKSPVVQMGALVKRKKGLPQGSPISPLLANLFLDKFDEALLKRNHKLIRYADDFIVCCKTKPRAEEAMKLTEGILDDLHLHLNKEKTAVTSFEAGFKYLGAIFLKNIITESAKPKKIRRAAMNEKKARRKKAPMALPERSIPEKQETTILAQALIDALKEKRMTTDDLVQGTTAPAMPMGAPDIPIAAPNISPFLRTLYIQEQGCWLKLEGERFIVSTGGEEGVLLVEIPTTKVEQVVIFGTCLITPAAVRYALLHNIPITLLSSRGQYFGRIESTYGADIALERMQFLRSMDATFMRDTAKTFVAAKLHNTKALLQRNRQKQHDRALTDAIAQLTRLEQQVATAESIDQVRGYEGHGSAVYFEVYDELFNTTGFTFEKRTRRPPTDPVNAMLSFGYTLLFNNIFSMARLHRLNPYVGSLHADKTNHPALVSDLIEEFRCLIEAMVLAIINKRILKPDDFHTPPEELTFPVEGEAAPAKGRPCLLSDEARKLFLHEFEMLMNRETTHPATGYKTNYRRCLDLQMQNYAQLVRGEKPYVPFAWR